MQAGEKRDRPGGRTILERKGGPRQPRTLTQAERRRSAGTFVLKLENSADDLGLPEIPNRPGTTPRLRHGLDAALGEGAALHERDVARNGDFPEPGTVLEGGVTNMLKAVPEGDEGQGGAVLECAFTDGGGGDIRALESGADREGAVVDMGKAVRKVDDSEAGAVPKRVATNAGDAGAEYDGLDRILCRAPGAAVSEPFSVPAEVAGDSVSGSSARAETAVLTAKHRAAVSS